MGLRHTARHLMAAAAARFAGAQAALLAAQAPLACPKEARVFDGMPIAIGKKDLQSHVDANRRSIISRMGQVARIWQFAHDQRIPVPIRPLDQVARFRRPLEFTVALDLDRRAKLTRDTQMPTIKPSILASGELPQLDAMPLIRAFETWETPSFVAIATPSFQGFVESVGKCLHGGRRNIRAAATCVQLIQGIAIQKSAVFLVVLPFTLQHFVVQLATRASRRPSGGAVGGLGTGGTHMFS